MDRRILFMITSLECGGAQQQLVHMARELKRRGWNALVVTLVEKKTFIHRLISNEIPTVSMRLTNPFSIFKAILYLRKLIIDFNPIILHSHQFHANILARIIRIFVRVPIVISTIHNSGENKAYCRILYKITDRLCNITTFVSQAAKNNYVQKRLVNGEKAEVISNSVDANEFCPKNGSRQQLRKQLQLDEKFVWLTVGRIEKVKDYPNMLKAFNIVSRQMHNAVLLICGDGILAMMIEKIVEAMALKEKVRFLGIRMDMPELMNAADAFLLNSILEGLPKVLLEAAATSLPIIATNVGGNKEIVINGVNGFLTMPGAPGLLAEKMLMLMQLPQIERSAMGEAGRAHVIKHFNTAEIMSLWEKLYGQHMQDKPLFRA